MTAHPELARPPRSLPFVLRLQLLFGGFGNQFGWFFLGFGLVFLRLFGGFADTDVLRFWLGSVKTAPGVVTSTRMTSATEGGSNRSSGTPIYEVRYTFAPDGQNRSGTSYGAGFDPAPGTAIVVEYLEGNPDVSRIQGCRGGIFPIWVLFVAIFPLVGGIFVFFGVRRGWKAHYLLSHGRLAWAVKKGSEPTNVRVNNRTVMKLTFEFEASDGRTYEIVEKTHRPERLEDNDREAVLYDPLAPSYAVMLDSLPGSPLLTPEGGFRTAGGASGVLVLILPVATVVGHGVVWNLF